MGEEFQYLVAVTAISVLVSFGTLAVSASDVSNVAIDPATGDLRVSFASNGKTANFLVALTNHVSPQVEALVEYRDGRYVYSYQVGNAPSAKQPIVNVRIVVDYDVQIASIQGPELWGHDPVLMTAENPDASTYLKPGGLLVRWSPKYGQINQASSGSILPGLRQGPFVLISDARPGFVRAYFASDVDRFESDPIFSAPPDIFRQVQPYLIGIPQTSVLMWIVGPAFPPSLDRSRVASLLLKQVQQLINLHQLSAESAFVGDVSAFLTAQAGNAAPIIPAFRHRPETATEAQLASVINFTFQPKPEK